MLKTSVNSDLYISLDDYKGGLKQARKDGFSALDVQFFAGDSPVYKLGEEELEKKLLDIKKCADKYKIDLFQMHMPTGLNETTDEKRLNAIKYYERAIKGASILGSKYAVLHTMFPFGWVANADKEQTEILNVELIKRLLPIAEKYGVIICVENLPWKENVGIPLVPDLKKFVDSFNSPYLKFCFDTGHACLLKDDIYQDVLTFGKDLKVLHIHENRRQHDDFHVLPFTVNDNLDWDAFIKGLKEIGYKGTVNLEINPPSKYADKSVIKGYRKFASLVAKSIADKI